MTKVLVGLSMSLDGYIAGPGVSPEEPMGRGGEVLHEWTFEGKSAARVARLRDRPLPPRGGADHWAPYGRGRDRAVGEEPTFRAPVFVPTHRPAATVVKRGGTSYTFVTEGFQAVLDRARQAAGSGHVAINGGADVARRHLAAGAVHELRLHLVPVILGAGTRLFDGET